MEENKPIHNEEEVKPPNNEQQLNNPSTDAPIVPTTETIIEAEQPSTLNFQPLNPAMEVHHHSHESHGKKNWKSYFWEFLMLFLAVFCGFFAEYKLEHTIEHQREKRYMISMVEDLKKDSAFLALSIETLIPYHLQWLDSTVNLLQIPDIKSKDRLVYQAFMVATGWTYNFHPTERTLSQLHSVGFHLIRNKNAINAISQLETQYKILNTQTKSFLENLQNDIDLSAWVFADRVVTDHIATTAFKNFSTASVELQLSDIPQSATINVENKEGIRSYVEKLKKYGFYVQYVMKVGQVILLKEVVKAIKVLEKEYHLK